MYPAFFVSTLVMVLIVLVSNHYGIPIAGLNTVVNFVLSVFLIHYGGFNIPEHSFNVPAWYITDLIMCYLAFYLIWKKTHNRGQAVTASFVMILIGLIAFRIYQIAPDIYLPIPFNLDASRALTGFFCGVLLGIMQQDLNERFKKYASIAAAAVCAAVCFAALMRFEDGTFEDIIGDSRQFCTLFLFPIVIFSVANIKPITWMLNIAPLRFLGKISYSIFLWHFPIIQSIRIINSVLELNIPYNSYWFFALYFSLVIGISTVSFYLIEAPGKRFLMAKEDSVFNYFNKVK